MSDTLAAEILDIVEDDAVGKIRRVRDLVLDELEEADDEDEEYDEDDQEDDE